MWSVKREKIRPSRRMMKPRGGYCASCSGKSITCRSSLKKSIERSLKHGLFGELG